LHFVCLPQNLVCITTPAHLLKGGLRPYIFTFGIIYFFTATAFINAWNIDWRLARMRQTPTWGLLALSFIFLWYAYLLLTLSIY
jgi:hypothetical protein